MASVTLERLRSDVYDRLDNNTDFYTTVQVDRAINNAIRTLNLFTGFCVGKGTVLSVARTATYYMPYNILIATSVKYGGRALVPEPFFSFLRSSNAVAREVADEFGFPVSTWTQLGLHRYRKLILFPAPAVADVSIEVTGIAEPTTLVETTDSVIIPGTHTATVVSLAAHECAMKAGGLTSSHAMLQYQEFLRGMKVAKRFKTAVNPRFWLDLKQPVETV